MDRLGPQEGPAPQSVWPGLKVRSVQRPPAVGLEGGHCATATERRGSISSSPRTRLGKPCQPADRVPGSSWGLSSSQGVARSDPKLSIQANGLPSEQDPSWRPGSLATFTSEVEVGPAGPSLRVSGSQSWREAVDRKLIQLQVRQHSSGTCSGPAGLGLPSGENEASSCLQGAPSLHGAETPLLQGVTCSRTRTQGWGSTPLV